MKHLTLLSIPDFLRMHHYFASTFLLTPSHCLHPGAPFQADAPGVENVSIAMVSSSTIRSQGEVPNRSPIFDSSSGSSEGMSIFIRQPVQFCRECLR